MKRAKSVDALGSSVSPFEAVKRALLRKGFVPEVKNLKNLSSKKSSSSGVGRMIGDSSERMEPRGKEANSKTDESGGDHTDELQQVAKVARDILYETDTVFPFTLFPDTISLEREKVNISKRFFFKVAKIIHIPVRDLLNVEADVGPFFGSLHISSRYYSTEPFTINFLWKSDTLQLQRLLQGYIIAYEREIDCSKIEKEKLIKLLNDIGKGHSEDEP